LILLHLPLSDVLPYALCPTFCPQPATRNPQHATRIPQPASRNTHLVYFNPEFSKSLRNKVSASPAPPSFE
jgi:hypothetical protein